MRKRWLSNVDFPRKVFFKKDLIKHIKSVHAKKKHLKCEHCDKGQPEKDIRNTKIP